MDEFRSYRNGYVWQDLSDDEDIIFPSGISYCYGGGEYVLKGSEITGDGHIHANDLAISKSSCVNHHITSS